MRRGRSLYEILQVDPLAEPEVLEAAFRRLARKYHPDISGLANGAERMKEFNAAYEILRDPARRAVYDLQLGNGHGPPPMEPEPEPAPEPPAHFWLTCRLHPLTVAVGACGSCGAGLCGPCFDRFRPAQCATCVESWASRPRHRLLVPALWFFIVLGAVAYLLASSTSLLGHSPP